MFFLSINLNRMKNRINLLRTVIYCFVFVIMFLSIACVVKKSQQTDYLMNVIKKEKSYSNKVEKILFSEYKYSNLKISKDFSFYKSKKAQSIDEIINKGKLFLCLPDKSCTTCYKELFSIFSKYVKNIGRENIVILTSMKHFHDFMITNSEFDLHISNIYAYKERLFEGNVLNENPYFFFIDKSYEISKVFVIDKNSRELFSKYLTFIEKTFYNKN